MKYLKNFKESIESNFFLLKDDISDMLLDLEDDGMVIDFHTAKRGTYNFFYRGKYEFVISKPDAYNKHAKASTFDVSNLILWKEVKDVIKRITNYVIDNGASIRYFSDSIEFGITSNKKEFISGFDRDDMSQFNLRILITEPQ
jgi:hypothetical protein